MAQPKRGEVELVVQGPDGQTLRRQLIEGQTIRIGRAPANGWAIEWDRSISREHADLIWQNGKLSVICLPTATNPIKLQGQLVRAAVVGAAEAFGIGQSIFLVDVSDRQLANDFLTTVVSWEPPPGILCGVTPDEPEGEFQTQEAHEAVEEHAYQASDLLDVSFGDLERQMEMLSNLPRLISGSTSDVDLALVLCELLLEAIPPAIAIAIVQFDDADVLQMRQADDPNAEIPKPKLMRVKTRDDLEGRFMPSRRLLRKALRRGESVMHIVGDVQTNEFTMGTSLDWAFCAPITAESCAGWCLYVSGSGPRPGSQFVTEDLLKGDLRFTQLVAQFIGSIRTVRSLQDQKTQMSAFFSPKVVESLIRKGAVGDMLAPSERDITVLFCDVREFSLKSEQLKDDLHKLLESFKAALSAMTGGILKFDGAISDFQGDAALGFWGWPTPSLDGPLAACRAAFSILQAFALPPGEQGLLEGFSCGVGIAHGRAIAGQIGTTQQAKIGVFGPIANQGSRIEGMTRQFGVGICIDETTANFVRRLMRPEEGRCRRLARVRPKGMDVSLLVHELLPPDADGAKVDNTAMLNYEAALDAVIAGRWDEATERLDAVPEEDGPKRFLLAQMAKLNNAPPSDWDGAFRLDAK